MDGEWRFLPDEATPFMVAAVRASGPGDAGAAAPGDGGPPAGDAVALGRELLLVVSGTADDDGRLAEVLAELARGPASPRAQEQLTDLAAEVFESDPAAAAGIGLGMVLRHVLGDEEAADAAWDRAAASDDPDLRAEAMYKIAGGHVSRRDATAAATMFRRVIGTGHPTWAAAAMVGLADVLRRGGDPGAAEALYREAAETGDADWSAHASWLLGRVLAGRGDAAGATVAWQRVIGSRSREWAGPAFIRLAKMLETQGDAGGLHDAYVTGAELGNPEALYALLQLGQLLETQGDLEGAHAAWRQASRQGRSRGPPTAGVPRRRLGRLHRAARSPSTSSASAKGDVLARLPQPFPEARASRDGR